MKVKERFYSTFYSCRASSRNKIELLIFFVAFRRFLSNVRRLIVEVVTWIVALFLVAEHM